MRRLTVVGLTVLGLAVGAGCREREEARTAATPAAERAVEDPLTGSVAGTVAQTAGSALHLHEADGKRIVLNTDGQTRVVRDGQPVGLEALQPGTEVRASYVISGTDWMAREVDVVSPAAK
ncbi:hypothetical protein F0U60_48915 [Archangium minus]|uniref:Lipoprotein n=1 Tax=Archangium minus TaxID=83450 RepID=A0ABY9X704_9BACT|nr:hypothetical protein F0U60_48915 [Archangium minus]